MSWKNHIINCEKCLSENKLSNPEKYDKMLDSIKENKLDIENIVFAGGGMRCVGYLGAIQVLEELNLLKNIKRFAGTSGGSIFAMLCSMNFTVNDMFTFASQNQKKYLDRRCVFLNWWYNLFYNNFGIYRGKVLETEIRNIIADKFKKDFPSLNNIIDPTFKDLFDQYEKDLIIVSTNLSTLSAKYFSHKLTPDMPVYLAIRASVSIPGFFESVVYNGQRYIDGGMSENYPLDVFLCSNKFIDLAEDTFDKTIGYVLLSSNISIKKENDYYEIESKTSTQINSSLDFATSIIDFVSTQDFEDEIALINTVKKDGFFDCTISAYTPCIFTSDFNATIDVKLDTIAIFKYLTIEFLYNKIQKLKNDNSEQKENIELEGKN